MGRLQPSRCDDNHNVRIADTLLDNSLPVEPGRKFTHHYYGYIIPESSSERQLEDVCNLLVFRRIANEKLHGLAVVRHSFLQDPAFLRGAQKNTPMNDH